MKIAVRKSNFYKPPQGVEPERGQRRHLISSVCLCLVLELLKVTRGFECDYRMLNASSARSSAHLAQGMSQSVKRRDRQAQACAC